jgi:hypothetical protein
LAASDTLKLHGMGLYHNQKAAESFSLPIDFHFSMFNTTKRGQENQENQGRRLGCGPDAESINLSDGVVQLFKQVTSYLFHTAPYELDPDQC